MDFDALTSSLDYVNRLLASHGFPSPLPLSFEDEESQESTVKIVNCVYALLQQRERDREWQSDAAIRIKKLASENESMSSDLVCFTCICSDFFVGKDQVKVGSGQT
jgi:hypothetical protein